MAEPYERNCMEARNTTPSARRTDPKTSQDAAASMREPSKGLRAELLAAYRSRPAGLTMDEAAAIAGIPTWGASKRISELRAAGLIVDSGETRPGASGRMQTVYRIPEEQSIPTVLFTAPDESAAPRVRFW